MKIIKPTYTESIVNLMGSVYQFFGGESEYLTLTEVDAVLGSHIKHVVLVVFDGMGFCALEKHLLPTDFLRVHTIKPIQSVFPPTTTAAMTSYYTGLSPLEHGWLGWSLYFKECGCAIDLFTNCNSYTRQPFHREKIAYEILPYTSIYKKIKDVCEAIEIHTLKPKDIYFPSGANIHHGVESLEDMGLEISRINRSKNRTFASAYWPEPDMCMHEFGPDEAIVKEKIDGINTWVEALSKTLSDTVLIVCADHGQTQIKEEIDLGKYPEIVECFVMPPAMEGRAMSFWIKNHKIDEFKQRFNSLFGTDFVLYSKKEVYTSQLLGMHCAHSRVDDFVGDFLACATSSKLMFYKTKSGAEPHHFKGHHAGLTEDEMLIPLIIKVCE